MLNNSFQFIILSLVCSATNIHAQTDWHLQPIPIQTRWAKDVSPANALPEYPRPQMVRANWTNLNGLWEYAVTESLQTAAPAHYNGKILVPYPIESALSGVKRALLPGQTLSYYRTFTKPKIERGERVLLHFGAVDDQATVRINDILVGEHRGGYTEFSFDITDALNPGKNGLTVDVLDSTDQGVDPRGKQVLDPKDIFYTATSGIWQTVWLEVVPAGYITDLKLTPDIDKDLINIAVFSNRTAKDYTVEATAYEGGLAIATKKITNNDFGLPVTHPHLWTPADPFLYHLVVKLKKGSRTIDEVRSYVGMRKISIGKDEQGVDRICLNNKPYYNLGVLDQGFWPEGIYTAPTDEALAFDIKAIKAMGFNTIRKHIKVEPERWYYCADSLGMLVWQDMVNPNPALPEGAKQAFEWQCTETVEQLWNHPSIVTWVLFNEKWGQYDQKRLTDWLHATDPTRLVNGHTGELLYVNEKLRSPSPNAYVDADMTDVHSYPNPMMPIKQPGKAQVLGEFGGIGVFIGGHQWNASSAWGYIQEKPADLKTKYRIMVEDLELLQKQGLSGSIYTQPFDVEGEQNGLMTYDRAVIKIPFDTLREIHKKLNPEKFTVPAVGAADADPTDPSQVYADRLAEYQAGRKDPEFLRTLAGAALQQGDRVAAAAVGNDVVATLSEPLTRENIELVAQLTRSTADKGFQLMWRDSTEFKSVLGERPYRLALMNAVYAGVIAPALELTTQPDWTALAEKAEKYGPAGDEILLRAETIDYLNKQDWVHYVPVAREYLQKYGADLRQTDQQQIERAIGQHGAGK